MEKLNKKKKKELASLTGKIAITDTALSPSGTVLIDGEACAAESENEHIDAGRGVRVTRIRGTKIFVRRV
jgi:membrane-bound serine protease (ClpP class)